MVVAPGARRVRLRHRRSLVARRQPRPMTPVAAPSSAIDAAAWATARETDSSRPCATSSASRRSTRRPPTRPDGELVAARRIAGWLAEAGLEPEIVEPVPGRGSVHARLRGDGTGGEPLLLLSHLDVVPAPPERWSHDPFAADLADGYVYGRGAVDMKAMVAMELGVVRLLAAEARAAGLDPARDPIPGLRRDVLFTCTADEEAGGAAGARLDRRAPPGLAARRPAPLNECGGVSVDRRRPAALPDPGRREGLRRVPHRGPRHVGPRLDAPRRQRRGPRRATSIARLAVPGPTRITPVMARFLELAAAALPADAAALLRLAAGDAGRAPRRPSPRPCDPMYARGAARAPARHDQPGRRSTPGSSTTSSRATRRSRSTAGCCPGRPSRPCAPSSSSGIGPELAAACEVELIVFGAPVEAPAEGDAVRHPRRDDPRPRSRRRPAPGHGALRDRRQAHRARSASRPTASRRSGSTPTSASSIGSTASTSASRSTRCAWGLPVLYDVVRRFCG